MALVLSWLAGVALAQQTSSETWRPKPVAGHAVLDLRVGYQSLDGQHPYLCGEVGPTSWLSFEACGNGAGWLHQAAVPDMAHFRARGRAWGLDQGRWEADFLVGAGLAEVARTIDQAGFRFGRQGSDSVEAAGPEAALSLKGKYWVDPGGKTYVTSDLTAGAALIPGAPDVLFRGGPVVPFVTLTAGFGF